MHRPAKLIQHEEYPKWDKPNKHSFCTLHYFFPGRHIWKIKIVYSIAFFDRSHKSNTDLKKYEKKIEYIDTMEISATIFELLSIYQLQAIFWGAFFFGETVVIAAAFLAAQGLWSIHNVFWLSLVGTIVADSLWFFLGQHLFKHKRLEKHRQKHQSALSKLETLAGEKPFLALLFIKFLYGTRILTIIYLSMRKVKFSLFLLFDTIGAIIWLFVILGIGWLAGKGIVNMLPLFKKIEYILLVLVIILILFKLGTTWISKKILKK